MAYHTKACWQMSPTWEQNPAVTGLVLPPTTILRNEYANSTGAKGERACILQARSPFELTKPVDSITVKFSEGNGQVINRSARGMLLLLPEEVDQ